MPARSRIRSLLKGGVCLAALTVVAPCCWIEALYRYELMQVDELPQRPSDATVLPLHRAIWVTLDAPQLRLEPIWPWTLVSNYREVFSAVNAKRQPVPSAGSWMADHTARPFVLKAKRREPPLTKVDYALRSIAVGIWLSRHFTAEELAVTYSANAYFGRGAFGIAAASKLYFNKTPADLEAHESAMLAGLLQAPTRYDPACNPESSLKRRHYVLSQMREAGFISAAEEARSDAAPLSATPMRCSRARESQPDD